jgi:hypothetical protein
MVSLSFFMVIVTLGERPGKGGDLIYHVVLILEDDTVNFDVHNHVSLLKEIRSVPM